VNPSPIRQAPDQLRSNPLGLDAPSVKATVEELNRTLATLYTLYHQVKKHHWVVEGPEYLPLHEFLDEWAAQLLKDADEVAERITALGGYPVSGPAEQEKLALIAMEPEGVYALRAMLEKDLADGGKLVAALRQYAQGAAARGDFGTEYLLKGILLTQEKMLHHLEHFLGDDTLVRALLP